jgi:myo-inositol 2-dehydrogenase / D-chiro-inositol 1-dehydrogenase
MSGTIDMKRIKTALLGAGRIGQEHGRNLVSIPFVDLAIICDPVVEAAKVLQNQLRIEAIVEDPESIFRDSTIQAVVICTPTDTHADLIERAAKAGKAIFCEKPVALELVKTQKALETVSSTGVPFQIGFQRRYDSGFAECYRRIKNGELGRLDQFRAVGRDPEPPPKGYLAKSGGLFLDQAIHEFDIARFLMGEVEKVQAWGSARFSVDARDLGDVDTAVTLLQFKSGALGVIENARQSAYGYDIVTEVFGEKGKILVQAELKTPLRYYGQEGGQFDHYPFFLDRFKEAYKNELESFYRAISCSETPTPGVQDAMESLRIGIAVTRSWKENRAVNIDEVI